ncbi:hypothetical protein MMC25_007337 [Agyrium rufum]|nr:hypothetical protein [Agyrium rufum]
MTEAESLDVLLQRSPLNEEERTQALEIARTLGYLALALDQAGAYIRARSLPLADFKAHYETRRKIILNEIPDEWEYRRIINNAERETALNVFTTWELSFQQINGNTKQKEMKAHFLTLAAFFDNTLISKRYFRAYFICYKPEWMTIFCTKNEWDSDRLGDLLAEFRKLSLVQVSIQRSNEIQFSFHPVVRDWIKLRRNYNTQQQFAIESIGTLSTYLQSVYNHQTSFSTNQETTLHINACVRNDREFLIGTTEGGLDINSVSATWFGLFYQGQGRYDEAETLFERALAGREKKLGPEHPDTLGTVENLATVYRNQGRYGEAETLYERALAGNEKKLGPEHPDTLLTVQNLTTSHPHPPPITVPGPL